MLFQFFCEQSITHVKMKIFFLSFLFLIITKFDKVYDTLPYFYRYRWLMLTTKYFSSFSVQLRTTIVLILLKHHQHFIDITTFSQTEQVFKKLNFFIIMSRVLKRSSTQRCVSVRYDENNPHKIPCVWKVIDKILKLFQ
jgi:hypothetical protein